MSSHQSDQISQRSQVSRIALLGCSLIEVDTKGVREVGRDVCRYVGRKIFFGQVMSPHHSDQMSQRSQVFWIAAKDRSLMEEPGK